MRCLLCRCNDTQSHCHFCHWWLCRDCCSAMAVHPFQLELLRCCAVCNASLRVNNPAGGPGTPHRVASNSTIRTMCALDFVLVAIQRGSFCFLVNPYFVVRPSSSHFVAVALWISYPKLQCILVPMVGFMDIH